MSRYTVAMDLASWRESRRSRKKRKGGRGRGAGREAQGREARRAKGAGLGTPPDLEPAVPLEKRRGRRGGRRWGRDAIRGEDEVLHEAELHEGELEPDDLGEESARTPGGRRTVRDRVADAVTRDWQAPMPLGERMRVQTRTGTRAAIIEVKPGLFVVADVPVESVEFGFGPMLLAPALIKTLGRAFQRRRSAGGAGRAHRPEPSAHQPRQLPGPTEEPDETEGRLAPWLDADVAEELGCPVCVRRDGRRP